MYSRLSGLILLSTVKRMVNPKAWSLFIFGRAAPAIRPTFVFAQIVKRDNMRVFIEEVFHSFGQ